MRVISTHFVSLFISSIIPGSSTLLIQYVALICGIEAHLSACHCSFVVGQGATKCAKSDVSPSGYSITRRSAARPIPPVLSFVWSQRLKSPKYRLRIRFHRYLFITPIAVKGCPWLAGCRDGSWHCSSWSLCQAR